MAIRASAGFSSNKSVGLTDQLVHLVWQKCTIDRCDFKDSGIVSSANVLKERVSRFLVQCQDGRHIKF